MSASYKHYIFTKMRQRVDAQPEYDTDNGILSFYGFHATVEYRENLEGVAFQKIVVHIPDELHYVGVVLEFKRQRTTPTFRHFPRQREYTHGVGHGSGLVGAACAQYCIRDDIAAKVSALAGHSRHAGAVVDSRLGGAGIRHDHTHGHPLQHHLGHIVVPGVDAVDVGHRVFAVAREKFIEIVEPDNGVRRKKSTHQIATGHRVVFEKHGGIHLAPDVGFLLTSQRRKGGQ